MPVTKIVRLMPHNNAADADIDDNNADVVVMRVTETNIVLCTCQLPGV